MNKEQVTNAVKELRKETKKRNFKQTVDLIINLASFDAKKTPVDSYILLPNGRGKKIKIAALVDKELITEAKGVFDLAILKDDFDKWQGDGKKLRKLAREYDYFVAQANIMAPIATVFGKYLGPKGRMPNPKNGSIIPVKIPSLKPIYEKLQNTVKVATKNEAIIKCSVGTEDNKDDEIVENIMNIYTNVLHLLPQEEANIKSVMIKTTMGKPLRIDIGGRLAK